ncbi:response regulator [Candidatus Bathyarchaeota archaeon]|nr:response regulator [bacterium]NIO38652.1 response regulator [Candidatus Bathyarchaeota archaeon]
MRLRKILIIDDDFPVGYLIKINLEAEGYEAILALSGEEGLEKAKASHPDLITLDVLMPEMDGFEVLEALKKDEALNSIPVMMISVVNGIRRKRGMEMGAADYLLKPVDFDNLLDRMRYLEMDNSPPE